jgi:hypothetical protein
MMTRSAFALSRCARTLFVNAGTTNDETETIGNGNVTTHEFVRVMVANALLFYASRRITARSCLRKRPDRGDVIRARERRKQHHRHARGLPR